MKFSQAILRLRKSLNLSQMAFAKELGVSFTSVNRWENEAQKPSPLALRILKVYCSERNLPFEYQQDTEEDTYLVGPKEAVVLASSIDWIASRHW